MNQAADYITKEKRKALEAELKDLKGPKRKEILEALAYAKSLGDLSENAEYHQAREDQGKLETRIKTIEEVLESSITLDGRLSAGGDDVIEIGSRVVVRKAGTTADKEFVIVGSQEADMSKGQISNRSPFGKALFGRIKGEKVSFTTPGGTVEYTIIDVA